MAVIRRMMGSTPAKREIFHDVLRLEQALTSGGGWQDQIGGGAGGTKITSTSPGLFPDPKIRYLPDDLVDPKLNGGTALLYYTGLTRLAKNILQHVAGGCLDRNRAMITTLADEHKVAHAMADALSSKDAAAFGHYIDQAWELQKKLCGYISGAGSGGFLLMISKSPAHADRIRSMLEREPLNERSRFCDFEVNHNGIEVSTC
jgi:fucokinase